MSSAWTFSFSEHARKDMKKLDKQAAAQVLSYIKAKLDGCADARAEGKALAGKLKGCWRYRTGNYRIVAQINDRNVEILALAIGHRREIYRRPEKKKPQELGRSR